MYDGQDMTSQTWPPFRIQYGSFNMRPCDGAFLPATKSIHGNTLTFRKEMFGRFFQIGTGTRGRKKVHFLLYEREQLRLVQ